jgi:hypothetical protein
MNVPTEAIDAAARELAHCVSGTEREPYPQPDPEDIAWAAQLLEAAAPLIRQQWRAEMPTVIIQVEDGGVISETGWQALGERLKAAWGDHATDVAAAERDRIRRHAQEHTFTLSRPGMGYGPAHGESMDVVPLTSLLEVL